MARDLTKSEGLIAGEFQLGDSTIEALGHNPTLRVGGVKGHSDEFLAVHLFAVECRALPWPGGWGYNRA